MTTLTVYGDAADNYLISSWDGEFISYADARGASPPGLSAAGASNIAVSVGQDWSNLAILYAFIAFDTSAIASGDTVSAATFNLTSYSDSSDTDFTINARTYDWGATLTTADWIAGANLTGYTLRCHYATASGWTANSAYNFTDDAMAAGVVKAGTTRLVLASSRTEGNNEPTDNEYVQAKSADTTGTTSDPKLTITYTTGGGGGSTARSFVVMA